MATPGQDIDAYLEHSGTVEPKRLDVAIVFARSMLRELRDSAADWERTATALQEIKQQQTDEIAGGAAARSRAATAIPDEWGPTRRTWVRRNGSGSGARRR
jgi:hypothetical protein